MPLESATYIGGLNATYPESGDETSRGDDHLRLIKSALKNTFPNVTAAITATAAQINGWESRTAAIEANYIKKDGSVAFTGPVASVAPTVGSHLVNADWVNGGFNARISSFNGRIGAVGLNATDVVNALGYTPWGAGNDGAGSGLDADLLDGQDSSFYTNIPARLGYTPPLPPESGWGVAITSGSGFTLAAGSGGTWAWFYICTSNRLLSTAGVSPGNTFLGVGGEGVAIQWRIH